MDTGLIHIYTGDGKGKTTAATGLAVRCAGAGGKVLICRFLKTNTSAELNILKEIPNITIMENPKVFHMIHLKDGQLPEGAKEYYEGMFKDTAAQAMTGNYDLLVMDELMATVNLGLVSAEDVVAFLKSRPKNLEVVMTGRNPAPEIADEADYISEIKKIKHPFDKGINARKGIEF